MSKYWQIRSELNTSGFITSVEETTISNLTPRSHGGNSFGHGAYFVIIVDNESEIEAAKFKCQKYVVDCTVNFNKYWEALFSHIKRFTNE